MGGNGHREPRRRADEGFPYAAGKHLHAGVQSIVLHFAEDVDHAQHGAKQAEQWRDLRDGGEQIQFFLEPRDFRQAGFLQRFAHAVAAKITVEDGGLDQPRDRPGRGVADRKRLDDVVALEDDADAVEELRGIDLRAMAVQDAFDEDHDGDGARGQNHPEHRPAID
jgi:hypothetical protein